MSNDSGHINVEFHTKAKDIFFSLSGEFKASVKTVDRKKSEWLFQQVKEQYVNTLKQQLQFVAGEIMNRNQSYQDLNEVDKNLSHFIKEYLHRFVQDIKRL